MSLLLVTVSLLFITINFTYQRVVNGLTDLKENNSRSIFNYYSRNLLESITYGGK